MTYLIYSTPKVGLATVKPLGTIEDERKAHEIVQEYNNNLDSEDTLGVMVLEPYDPSPKEDDEDRVVVRSPGDPVPEEDYKKPKKTKSDDTK